MLALAGTLTRVATLRSAWGRTLRNLILRVLNHVPPIKRRLARNLSGLSRRNFARLPESAVAGRTIRSAASRRGRVFPISAAG